MLCFIFNLLNSFKLAKSTFSSTLICLILLLSQNPACFAKKTVESWESLARTGKQYQERALYKDAIEYYLEAVKILEKQNIQDIRAAVVYKDLAASYSVELKPHMVKIYESKSAEIYKHEIEEGKLGNEYSETKNLDPVFITLRPACPLCNQIKKVVPLHYGDDTGYSGAVPAEKDVRFTQKPAGPEFSDERWYCKSCHQMF